MSIEPMANDDDDDDDVNEKVDSMPTYRKWLTAVNLRKAVKLIMDR